jgi:hypothetical protein
MFPMPGVKQEGGAVGFGPGHADRADPVPAGTRRMSGPRLILVLNRVE